MIERAVEHGCRDIMQVGDWGYTWPGELDRMRQLDRWLADAGIHMWFIDGNHDNFTDLKKRKAFGADHVTDLTTNITYIPRGHIWEWAGATCMAMGGAFSIDQDARVEGVSWWPEELISYADLERAADNLDKLEAAGRTIDVFFSHDCPEGVGRLETHLELTSKQMGMDYKLDESSRANRRALWLVVERAKPAKLFHGHYHFAYWDTLKWDGHAMLVAGLDCDGTKESFTILEFKE